MKKKIFSKGLYLEGLRQLRMMGIITTVILTLLAVLIPAASGISLMIQEKQQVPDVGTVDSGYTYIPENELFADQEEVTREIISGASANPFLFAIFLVVAPLMAVVLFSFLTKRRTSDFYHSIPHTRISIFLSFSASILTWIAVEILVTSAAAALTYLIFSKYFELLFTDLLILMVSSFAASLLAVGAVSIAVSLTGTVGSNVLLSLMILFLPRILIFAVSNTMLEQTPILARSGVFPLFADDYNLYTAVLLKLLGINFDFNITEPYFQLHGILYSLILGLIYLGLGLLLFALRKSESAERSAPSRTLQTVYRTLFTCAFCLIPCIYFFVTATDGYGGVDGDTVLSMVIFYILALIIYFGYEILTTRKWKNLLRAIPGLAIVLAVNLAVIGGLFGIRAFHLSFSPDADEISGISVIPNDEPNYYRDLSFEDYVNSQMDEIVLDSDEVKEAVSNALSENVSVLKNSLRDWNLYGDSDRYYYEDYGEGDEKQPYEEMTFRIRTKFGSKVRHLKIAPKDASTINQLLIENEQYFDLWTSVPEPAGKSIYYSYGDMRYYAEIPRESVKEFTDTLRQEVAGMDVQTWIDLVRSGRYTWDSDRIATVDYPIRVGTSVDFYSIPISYRYMPKTAALILKMNSNDADAQKSLLDQLKNIPKGYSVSGSLTFFLPDSEGVLNSGDLYIRFSGDPEADEIDQAVLALLLEKAEFRPVEYGEPFVEMHLDLYRVSEEGKGSYMTNVSYNGFVPLSSLTAEDLEKCGIFFGPVPGESYPIYG